MKKKIIAIIEARLRSKRLPKKLLLKINNKPAISYLIQRVKRIKQIDKIVIATSNNPIDNLLEKFAIKNNLSCFRGSEKNVLQRVYFAAKKFKADAILQVSGDSLFLDPEISDQMISIYKNNKKIDAVVDYWDTFPAGINPTVLSLKSLKQSYLHSKMIDSVSYYIFKNSHKFKIIYYFPKPSEYFPKLNLCLDEYADYKLIKKFILKDKKNVFSCSELVNIAKKNIHWLKINKKITRKSKNNIDKILGRKSK